MYQVENPVVIDSLWRHCRDWGRDVEEEEMKKIEFEIDTSRLTNEECLDFIGELQDLMFYDGEQIFSVIDDLPENDDDHTEKIEVCGVCPERIFEEVIDVFCRYNISY